MLLPKEGDLQQLKNWRPDSLLCSDYKLLFKVYKAGDGVGGGHSCGLVLLCAWQADH